MGKVQLVYILSEYCSRKIPGNCMHTLTTFILICLPTKSGRFWCNGVNSWNSTAGTPTLCTEGSTSLHKQNMNDHVKRLYSFSVCQFQITNLTTYMNRSTPTARQNSDKALFTPCCYHVEKMSGKCIRIPTQSNIPYITTIQILLYFYKFSSVTMSLSSQVCNNNTYASDTPSLRRHIITITEQFICQSWIEMKSIYTKITNDPKFVPWL